MKTIYNKQKVYRPGNQHSTYPDPDFVKNHPLKKVRFFFWMGGYVFVPSEGKQQCLVHLMPWTLPGSPANEGLWTFDSMGGAARGLSRGLVHPPIFGCWRKHVWNIWKFWGIPATCEGSNLNGWYTCCLNLLLDDFGLLGPYLWYVICGNLWGFTSKGVKQHVNRDQNPGYLVYIGNYTTQL